MLSEQQLTRLGTLVSKFHQLSPNDLRKYQETEVRTNFIDPLFAILGWRMDDRAYVERETTVEEGKRPDYAFKISGVPPWLLAETVVPSENMALARSGFYRHDRELWQSF